MDKLSEISVRVSILVCDFLDDSLEHKIIMGVDIKTFGVNINCFDKSFLVLCLF